MEQAEIRDFYARTYDQWVKDWPGEIDFYLDLASKATSRGESTLEVACGTGRIALRLALSGAHVTGIDLSTEMLTVAQVKRDNLQNLQLAQADMRFFSLDERFGLVIIPGHSFQFMLTTGDQLDCLENILIHLVPGGRLIVHLDHQDLRWLGELYNSKELSFEKAEHLVHPDTNHYVQAYRAWTYEQSTQTAAATTRYKEMDDSGQTIHEWERGPIQLHCFFRYEMEHLLRRAGYQIDAVYGDFLGNPLHNKSGSMVWSARI